MPLIDDIRDWRFDPQSTRGVIETSIRDKYLGRVKELKQSYKERSKAVEEMRYFITTTNDDVARKAYTDLHNLVDLLLQMEQGDEVISDDSAWMEPLQDTVMSLSKLSKTTNSNVDDLELDTNEEWEDLEDWTDKTIRNLDKYNTDLKALAKFARDQMELYRDRDRKRGIGYLTRDKSDAANMIAYNGKISLAEKEINGYYMFAMFLRTASVAIYSLRYSVQNDSERWDEQYDQVIHYQKHENRLSGGVLVLRNRIGENDGTFTRDRALRVILHLLQDNEYASKGKKYYADAEQKIKQLIRDKIGESGVESIMDIPNDGGWLDDF